jgi:hypothetical protein
VNYVQLAPETPTPFMQAIVPQVDQAGTQEFWMQLRDLLRGRQPELNLNDVKLIAGVSGETLMQVLKPTEASILAVRPAYDHALIRGLQMSLSIGADLGRWDVGTGNGTGAGDRAYAGGLLRFAFGDRPALPQTPMAKTQAADAEQADKLARFGVAKAADGIVDNREKLKIAGYDAKDIALIEGRLALQDTLTEVGNVIGPDGLPQADGGAAA